MLPASLILTREAFVFVCFRGEGVAFWIGFCLREINAPIVIVSVETKFTLIGAGFL